MVELDTFAKSHPRFQKIVNSYLNNGGKLVIKGRSLKRYTNTPEVYVEYGQLTTVLELVDFKGYGMLLRFPNLTDLILRQVRYNIGPGEIPLKSLTSLKIFYDDRYPEMEELIEATKQSLRHLLLCYNTSNASLDIPKLPSEFGELKSLTLVNVVLEKSGEEQQFPTSPVLEKCDLRMSTDPVAHLMALRDWRMEWNPYHGQPVMSLTLESWDEKGDEDRREIVKSFTNLKHLRILGAVSSELKEGLMDLNLESVDAHYFDKPAEDQDEDVMLDMLDDDCLHLIMDFLNAEALASLCQVHSRFGKVVVARRRKMEFDLSSDILKRFPVIESRAFYGWLARIVATLLVWVFDEDKFYGTIGLFKNLDELHLHYITFSDEKQFSSFPANLRSLDLYEVAIRDSMCISKVSTVFKRLNPTLVTLRLREITDRTLIEGLTELRNVRDLLLSNSKITPELVQFLTQNQKHMERLELETVGVRKGLTILPVVRDMKNIKSLILKDGEYSSVLNQNSFPELEKLHLNTNVSNLGSTLMGLEVPKLRHFNLEMESKRDPMIYFGKAIKDSMPQIEKFTIKLIYLAMSPETIVDEILLGPTEIKTLLLHYEGITTFPDHLILDLIKGMPKLTNLRTNFSLDTMDWDVMRELRAYLKQSNRKLQLNHLAL